MSFTYQTKRSSKVIKLAIESYVDSVHSFIFMHMPLCIQTESVFLKKGNGSGLKVTKPSRQEINKQAIIYSGIAEEYVNWIQCLSCDIWVHEKCARGTFSDRCKACHSQLTYSALEKRSSKPDQYLERS